MQRFDAHTSDPFAVYHAPLKAARLWRNACAALGLLVALLSASLVVATLRPPTVIVYDRHEPGSLRVARMSDAADVTTAEARLFFSQMLHLRYGWDSLTVKRDLEQFLAACYKPQRERELAFFRAPVGRESGGKSVSRLSDYMRQTVAHALVLPDELRQIDCRRRTERKQWDCYVRADLLTRPLLSTDGKGGVPMAKQSLQFVGTLLEAPRSTHTPYGLVLAALHFEAAAQPAAVAEGS